MEEMAEDLPRTIREAIEVGSRQGLTPSKVEDRRFLIKPAFESVLSAVDTWEGPGRDEAIVAANHALDAWPDAVRSECARGEAMLDALLDSPSWPLVRSLEVHLPDLDAAARFAERPELARLRSLDLQIDEPLDPAGVRRIFRSPYLSGLTSLRLGEHYFREPAAEALAREPLLGQLESLSVPGSAEIIFAKARLDRLESLDFCGGLEEVGALLERFPSSIRRLAFCDMDMEEKGAAALLAGSGALAGVVDLELSGVGDGAGRAVAEALAGNRRAGRLERLSLCGASSTWVGIEGFLALGEAAFLENLIALNLQYIPAGPAGWEALAQWPLGNLRRLSLAWHGGGDAGAAALAASPHLANLEELHLGYNGIGQAGVAALARAPWLDGIRLIDLEMNPVGDPAPLVGSPSVAGLTFLNPGEVYRHGFMAVADSPHLGRLEYLGVGCSGLDPECVAALGRSPAGASVSSLMLAYSFDDCCARVLADGPGFGRLRRFNPCGNLTPEGVAALAKSPKLAGLWSLGFSIDPLGPKAAEYLAGSPHLRSLTELGLFGCRIGPAGSATLARSPVARTLRRITAGEDELPAWTSEPNLLPILRARAARLLSHG